MGASIVSTLTTAFTSTATAIGSSIVNLFNDIFVAEGGGLTNVGIYIIALAGVGFAFGLSKAILSFGRNRG